MNQQSTNSSNWVHQVHEIENQLRFLRGTLEFERDPLVLKKHAQQVLRNVETLVYQMDARQFPDVDETTADKWQYAQRLVTSTKELLSLIEYKSQRIKCGKPFINGNGDSNETLKKMTYLQKAIGGLKDIFSHLSTSVKEQDELLVDIENQLDSVNENVHQGKSQLNGALDWISAKRGLLAKIGIGVSVFVVGVIFLI